MLSGRDHRREPRQRGAGQTRDAKHANTYVHAALTHRTAPAYVPDPRRDTHDLAEPIRPRDANRAKVSADEERNHVGDGRSDAQAQHLLAAVLGSEQPTER